MSDPTRNLPSRLFSRSNWPEAQHVATLLRAETVGGGLLLLAAAAALVWANLPVQESYRALGETVVGPSAIHLDLSLNTWAADGLLAIFFFVAGLELKREFLVGDLKDPAKAAVPIAAAICGVALPALFFTAVVLISGDTELLGGWAIPTATDIAFALAVLAVLGSHLPSALRSFLLTLAVVDDLVAITIIAIFYTSDLSIGMLGLAMVPLLAFAALVQRRLVWWWALIPLALLTWVLVHESGVHATVAGVLLGLVVPVKTRQRGVPRVSTHDADVDVAHRLEHRLRPLSAGVAVPVFAFFAAGVSFVGDGAESGFVETVTSPLALAIAGALVFGKLIGVFGGTYVFARFTRAELDDDLAWSDIVGLSLLAGIGFTVSLLISELAFPEDALLGEAKLAVLLGSLIAAALAAVVLRGRNKVYRRIYEEETSDQDGDGIPDAYDPFPDVPQASTK